MGSFLSREWFFIIYWTHTITRDGKPCSSIPSIIRFAVCICDWISLKQGYFNKTLLMTLSWGLHGWSIKPMQSNRRWPILSWLRLEEGMSEVQEYSYTKHLEVHLYIPMGVWKFKIFRCLWLLPMKLIYWLHVIAVGVHQFIFLLYILYAVTAMAGNY